MGDFNDKTDSIKTLNQLIIVNILYNLSYMYYSHYIIIKYIGFKPIYYAINLYIVLYFINFNEFNSLFLLNILLI